MIKFSGINHLALIVPDMEQAVRFYREELAERIKEDFALLKKEMKKL